MNTQISTYEQQAIDFLQSTETSFNAAFIKYDKYFQDDKEPRDIYKITLQRGDRSYTFEFGQSVNASGNYIVLDHKLGSKIGYRITSTQYNKLSYHDKQDVKENKAYSIPTPYDVLACLTKYHPGSFDDFCSGFGYDTDSKKAEKTYNSVMAEWLNIERLFTDKEIQLLQEIN